MIVKDYKESTVDGFKRVSARVQWEDCARDDQEIYFSTDIKYADYLQINPDAFFAGCAIPAQYHGEKRIKIEGEICPVLKDGIETNMKWYQLWYGETYKPVVIEAAIRKSKLFDGNHRKAGLFLSGGIDSLYSLRHNKLTIPKEHPDSIQECFFVHGFDIGFDLNKQDIDRYYKVFQGLKSIADDAHVSLIPVFTNLRQLERRTDFWTHWYHGTALASVAHCFSSKISKVLIAASDTILTLKPHGSHPIADENLSSNEVRIKHDGLVARIDKVKLISEWNVAMRHMHVCFENPPDKINCGQCEKCLRTMIALVALGKLRDETSFEVKDISPYLMNKAKIHAKGHEVFVPYYREVIPLLRKQGREDLCRIIQRELGWRGNIRRFDEKYLNQTFIHLYANIRKLIRK